MAHLPHNASPDQRASIRRRVILSGRLVYGQPEMTIDCAISDMSDTGARVRLKGSPLLVNPVYLIDIRHGLAFRAREVWRQGSEVGLAFSRYFDLNKPGPDLPAVVRRIWVEQIR
jgi:hypothetical protein